MRTLALCVILVIICNDIKAQDFGNNSLVEQLPIISNAYLSNIESKVDKYHHRISSKTVKTIEKLSRWENKLRPILQKANPQFEQQLFGSGKLTFSTLLEKYRKGEQLINGYQAKYDSYRDKINTGLKYYSSITQTDSTILTAGKKKAITAIDGKLKELNIEVENVESLEKLIKERKAELLAVAAKMMLKNKNLQKINKEVWYYAETLRNYKELFSTPTKAEATIMSALNRIPAFKSVFQQNSQIASLLHLPGMSGGANGSTASVNLAGLQTRASVNQILLDRIGTAGPNPREAFAANLNAAQNQLNELKQKLANAGGAGELPDFKPNTQKTKTFKQRLELSTNFQFQKPSGWMPQRTDLGLNIGYKLNDKSIAGVGFAYKLGMGSFSHFKLTNEGLGLRSFIDWKMKKQFFISGGFEMNYLQNAVTGSPTVAQPMPNINSLWQPSGLIGVSKKIAMNTKWVKGAKLQLFWDFLSNNKDLYSKNFLFRINYNF